MQALREIDEETGEGSLTLDHVIHAWPPIVYNRDGTIKKTFPHGNPNDIDARFGCFSNERLCAHGVVGLDLSAANEFCGNEVAYTPATKASSFAHNTRHCDTSKHATIAAVPDDLSFEEFVESLWPGCLEMHAATDVFNSGAYDVSGLIIEPSSQRRKAPAKSQPKGAKSRVPSAPGAARNAADRQNRGGDPDGAEAFEYGGTKASDELRARGFKPRPVGTPESDPGGIDNFVTDVDTSQPGAYSAKPQPGAARRLVLIPHVPKFGERTLLDICGGDPDVAKFFMLLCTLHLAMRMTELTTDTSEKCLREPMMGGSVSAQLQSALDRFNRAMRDPDQGFVLRHQIQMNTATKSPYASALDGKDTRLLNTDWERLVDADLDARPLDLSASRYFSALQKAHEDMAMTSEDDIDRLARLATCAREFALAMRALRKSADQMRDEMRFYGDNERTYRAFEKHAVAYCTMWTVMGNRHKGYGFHLWASLPVLFRRYGCMEALNQSVMEGSVGQLKRVLQHVQLNAAGDYSQDAKWKGEEAKRAELAKRQARQWLPAQAVHAHFLKATFHTPYTFVKHKNKKVITTYTPADVQCMIDAAIEKREVYPAAELHEANKLYKLFGKLKQYAHACAAIMRAKNRQAALGVFERAAAAADGADGSGSGAEGNGIVYRSRYYEFLAQSVQEFYATYPPLRPTGDENGLHDHELDRVHNLRMRKADWQVLDKRRDAAYEKQWRWGPGSDLSAMRARSAREMAEEAAQRAAGTWVPKPREE